MVVAAAKNGMGREGKWEGEEEEGKQKKWGGF
jgi:hypothetical protein